MAITRVADGKIVEDETFWNVLDFYQQLGFTLSPPQPLEPPEEKKQLIRNQVLIGGQMKKLCMVLPLALILCFMVGCQDKEAMAELEAFKAQAEVEEQNNIRNS
jgi:hypothetical protein